MTVLIVGLWREAWAAVSSVRKMNLMSSLILVSTSQFTQCTERGGCCHGQNVTADVLKRFPRAIISLDETSDHFMGRMHTALVTFEQHIRLAEWLLVLRPDVQLTRSIPTHVTGLGIIPGNIYRPFFFSNTDWDFGYIARPPNVLRYWICCYYNTTLPELQPQLPTGIQGEWKRRDAVYENSIIKLRDRHTPIYGVTGAVLKLQRCNSRQNSQSNLRTLGMK